MSSGSADNPIEISSEEFGDSETEAMSQEYPVLPVLPVSKPLKRKRSPSSTSSCDDSSDDEHLLQHCNFSKSSSPIKKKPGKGGSCIEYHCGRKEVPIFSRKNKHYSTKQIIETVLDPELNPSCICTMQPTAVECNSVFLVDLKHLKKPKDILCDNLGAWKCNGCHYSWVVVDEDGVVAITGKEKPTGDEGSPYRITKRYYNHKGSPDFHRLVVFVEDCDGDLLNLALVHYTFDNEEHKILSRPHGNSKSHNPYIRTKPSTLHKLREVSQYLPPKHAVGEVSKSVGGVAGAYSIAELPRNRQQSSDCRRKLFLPSQSAPVADPLFPIMIMCKESEGVNSDPSLRFVRIVTNSPEPMAVLAFDWTLADLERFCSKPLNHTVLSVDPTFNLGSFHVTVTTYKHPMLEYKNKKGCHPVMLGPLFIHQRKAFSTYNFFFSQLIGLRPALCDLQCYGTDGEKALEEALCMQFRSGTHLRCFLHFRGNLESKLSDLGISKPDAQEFVKDVLGNPAQLEEGLVDADSDLLDEEFEVLRKKWNERESLLTKTTEPHFHDWFRVNCLSVVRNSMLKHKRIAAGLGSPPDPFYTNDVESKNRVLKHQTSYRAQQLPSFVQSMRRMYEDQKEEVERAVVGLGEYRLCSPYRDLGVNSKEWCKKNEKQRERILKRFQNAQLKSEFGSESPDFNSDSSVECAHDKQLPSSSNPLINTRLSESIQMSMWAKVQSYLGDSASYTNAPGVMDYSCLLVKSQSSTRPHFVQKTGSGAYKCDKECLMFKSTNGVCSHSLLAANLNGELDLFVNRYSKTKVPTNYANLAQHGLPVGGKKPSTRRKSSSKKTTAAVKNLIADADHVKRTKRTPVTTSTIPVTLTTEERLLTCAPVTSSTAGNSTVYAPYSSINSLSTNISVASPRPPPPLLHFSPGSSSVGQLFYIVFLNSRISRCQGCRGQIVQGLPSPHDIVIQHKEHVLFQNPNTGNWQLSKDLRNTYYHPRFGCISVKHPDFSSSELKISAEVRCKLLPSHFTLLNAEFGLWQF